MLLLGSLAQNVDRARRLKLQENGRATQLNHGGWTEMPLSDKERVSWRDAWFSWWQSISWSFLVWMVCPVCASYQLSLIVRRAWRGPDDDKLGCDSLIYILFALICAVFWTLVFLCHSLCSCDHRWVSFFWWRVSPLWFCGRMNGSCSLEIEIDAINILLWDRLFSWLTGVHSEINRYLEIRVFINYDLQRFPYINMRIKLLIWT